MAAAPDSKLEDAALDTARAPAQGPALLRGWLAAVALSAADPVSDRVGAAH